MFLGQARAMPTAREDWERLASYVVSARVAAGHKDRRAFAAATGVTERTLGNLERGTRVAPETLAIVEAALGWKPGSARTVLAGGDPLLLSEPRAPATADIPGDDQVLQYVKHLPGLSPADRESLTHVARSPGLSADMRRALVGWVLAVWEQDRAQRRPA
jgi:Helix-turn-helix